MCAPRRLRLGHVLLQRDQVLLPGEPAALSGAATGPAAAAEPTVSTTTSAAAAPGATPGELYRRPNVQHDVRYLRQRHRHQHHWQGLTLIHLISSTLALLWNMLGGISLSASKTAQLSRNLDEWKPLTTGRRHLANTRKLLAADPAAPPVSPAGPDPLLRLVGLCRLNRLNSF